jgi:hypothetical protein
MWRSCRGMQNRKKIGCSRADLVQRRVAVIFVAPNVGFARIAKNRFLPPVATLWNMFSWRI